MSEHFPRIRLQASHGAPLIRESLAIGFYMRRSHHEVAQAVSRSFEAYLRAIGPGSLTWRLDPEGDWQPLDERGWEATRRKLSGTHCSRVVLRDDPSGAHAFRFEYYGKTLDQPQVLAGPDMVCALACWLPTEFLEAHGPARVRELALELAGPLPFHSGHAGLCFQAVLGSREASEPLSHLCLRYPGVDLLDVQSLSMELGTRLKGPAWMTFVGQPVLGSLGGVAGLHSRLRSPATMVEPIEGSRAVITLGPWPEAGDLSAGRTLPEYRELAEVLEPWLYRSGGWAGFPDELQARWERRFLD